ncbi:MAG: hypothetical protein V1768_01915 [Patescibacteria group bacterium]
MENEKITKFTLWDSVVLLILIIIVVPFAIGILEGVVSQIYERIFVNLLLLSITLAGVVKYSKKLLNSIKNRKTK